MNLKSFFLAALVAVVLGATGLLIWSGYTTFQIEQAQWATCARHGYLWRNVIGGLVYCEKMVDGRDVLVKIEDVGD